MRKELDQDQLGDERHRLPKFGTPNDFVELHDIVKLHVEQDSSWAVEIAKVANMAPGQVQQFMKHLIKDWAVLL
jgi:hypothetical protein